MTSQWKLLLHDHAQSLCMLTLEFKCHLRFCSSQEVNVSLSHSTVLHYIRFSLSHPEIHTYLGLCLIFHTWSRTVLGFTQPMSPKRRGLVSLHPSVARLFYRPVKFHPRSSWVGQALWFGKSDGSAPVDPATAAFDMSIPAQAVRPQHVF